MGRHKIGVESKDWESPIPGVRQKTALQGPKRVRFVEYSREMEPHWCEAGHYGYVLDGVLEIEFDDETDVFESGDAVLIPHGPEHRHRARVLTDTVRVVFVEDV